MFPKKAYKKQKKYIWNSRKPLVLGSHEWISRMIKLNDYLEFFPVLDGVSTTKIAHEEFINVLEDGVLYHWNLEFEKEGFDSSSSTLKDFLGVCIRLEAAELQKPLKKKIAHAIKEHDDLDNKKSKSRHETRQGQSKHYRRLILHQQSKHYGGKCRKKY
eukprot:9961692-Ditylum_brightwellii.AAC.1